MNPEHRLTVAGILERLAAIAETNSYNLRAPLDIQVKKEQDIEVPAQTESNHISRAPPPRPQASPAHQPPPRPPQRPAVPPAQLPRVPDNKHASYGLFSSIKGGAGSFLKNLKDTSSKVMQTMQQ